MDDAVLGDNVRGDDLAEEVDVDLEEAVAEAEALRVVA